MNTAITTPETTSTLLQQLQTTYNQPFLELLFQAQQVHRENHPQNVIQLATLANIKSGNCPEDCKYCPQSSRYNTGVDTWDLPTVEEIKTQVQTAKANGSSRFCMGAAWRTPPSETHFQQVIELVKTVKAEGVEACVTLGMINPDQAHRLKEAGLTAYNHNLDTSPQYYPEVITTRTYDDRLNTLKAVGDAGLQVCCGGILGMGETLDHRLELLEALLQLEHLPESVPINCLVPVAGTPMAANEPVDPIELVRLIATTRIHLPKAKVRLSAGRLSLSEEGQALCFAAGANSIFSGDTLLTTPNPEANTDAKLFAKLGLTPTEPVLVHGA
ncbi:MAG: biotin synthase BioB [Vampirovibrio sp.]|nr:biotin synthase BioB [Vampirovibrio sp.]